MATMYQTRVSGVEGKTVTDDNGDTLTRIGNMPVKAGDFVWTDGAAVYGFVEDTAPARPYVPPLSGGILYAESATNYKDEVVYRYRRSKFAEAPGDRLNLFYLVDGEAACWAVCPLDVDTSKQIAVNLTNGATYRLPEEFTFNNDACTDAEGQLIFAIGGRTVEDALIHSVRVYETTPESSQFTKISEITDFDTAALKASAIAAVRNLCPRGADSVYAGNPNVLQVAVHPDRTWNAIVSIQANTQSGYSTVTIDAFHDVYRVWDYSVGDGELIFESDEMVSDSWAGPRPRSASVVRRYIFNSGGNYKRIYSSWRWDEAPFRVSGPSYDRRINTEEERAEIPPYYVQELERLGFDVSAQPLPFAISHRYYSDELPRARDSGVSYDSAAWRLDDTTATYENDANGGKSSVYGHTFAGLVKDAYARGEMVIITMITTGSTTADQGAIYEFSHDNSGKISQSPAKNYRTRYCRNISRAKAIIETL